jgi:hypothetical protein
LNCNSKFNKQKKAIRSGLPNNEKRKLKRSTISHGNANLRGVNKMSPTDLMNSRPINKSDQVSIVMYSNYFLELSVPVLVVPIILTATWQVVAFLPTKACLIHYFHLQRFRDTCCKHRGILLVLSGRYKTRVL